MLICGYGVWIQGSAPLTCLPAACILSTLCPPSPSISPLSSPRIVFIPLPTLPPSISSLFAVLPPNPSPSPRLPALLSLGAVWGDGCGFCRWCLQSMYRLTASELFKLPPSHFLSLCIQDQNIDVDYGLLTSCRNRDRLSSFYCLRWETIFIW